MTPFCMFELNYEITSKILTMISFGLKQSINIILYRMIQGVTANFMK